LKNTKIKIIELSLLIFLPVVNVFISPTIVTYDGFRYLASAKSLFTDDFLQFYDFTREVGYPFFIKVIFEIFGYELKTLFVAQVFIVTLGTLLLLRLVDVSNVYYVFVAICLMNPIFIIFVNSPLQQGLIYFMVVVNSLVIKEFLVKDNYYIFLRNTLVFMIFASQISIILIYLGLTAHILTILVTRKLNIRQIHQYLFVLISLVILLTVVKNEITVKNRFNENVNVYGSYVNIEVKDIVYPYIQQLKEGQVKVLIQKWAFAFKGNLMLGPTSNVDGVQEGLAYTTRTLLYGDECGFIENYPDKVVINYLLRSNPSVSLSCNEANQFQRIYTQNLLFTAQSVYKMFIVGYLLIGLIGLRFLGIKTFLPLYLSPLILILIFTTTLVGIDRYGSFLYPYAIIVCVSIVSNLVKYLRGK
jgi:hypothetical protein